MCALLLVGSASAAGPPEPSFFARRDYLQLYNQQSVGVADTNGDGIPDLIGANGSVSVLFGNGDGTFRGGPLSQTGMTFAGTFVAADLNGDGKVDLVLAGGRHGTAPPLGIGVSFGNGLGEFKKVVFYPAGNESAIGNPVLGDFNGDDIPDVAVVGSAGVWLFTGIGDGTFHPGVLAVSLSASGGGYLAAADFNSDHKLDLVATMPFDGSGNGSVVLFGNGDGTFQAPVVLAEPKKALGVAAGRLTKGGYPGIALVPAGSSEVYLYHSNGAGGFSAAQHANLPGGPGIAVGDVNGDGFPDLVSAGGYIALGTASGAFKQPIYHPVQNGYGSHNVLLADLRKNGLTDIVTDAEFGVSVLLSMGKGKFEDGARTLVTGGTSCGATADFNGDGKPDLAVNTPSGITIMLGTGTAKPPFTTGASIPLTNTGCLVTGDLNGDGIPDLLVPVNGTPNALFAYLGNGDGTFTLKGSTPTPNSGGYVVLADFNHDGKLDFATSGNLLALGNGDGTFQTPAPFIANPPFGGYSNIAVGDVNNDGWPDLVLTNIDIPYVPLYVGLNDHQGGFTPVANTLQALAIQAALADLNGDGNLDLVLQGPQGGASVYLGDGAGGFTFQVDLSDPIGFPGFNMVADLNGDGVPDIALLESDTLEIYLGNGGATYAAPFSIGTGPSPGGLLVANLHGQSASAGLPDIVAPDLSFGVMTLINQAK